MPKRSLTAAFGPRSSCVEGIEYVERALDAALLRRSGPRPIGPMPLVPPQRRLDISVDDEPSYPRAPAAPAR